MNGQALPASHSEVVATAAEPALTPRIGVLAALVFVAALAAMAAAATGPFIFDDIP